MGVEVIFARIDALVAGARFEGAYDVDLEEEVFTLYCGSNTFSVFLLVEDRLQVSGDRDFRLRKWLDGQGISYFVC